MRLTRETIYQIIKEVDQGVPRSVVARQNRVDTSTVRYHVEAFENKYGSTSAVYALIPPPRKACVHPSLKCLICGEAQDHIHRREVETINELTRKLDRANALLVTLGYSVE